MYAEVQAGLAELEAPGREHHKLHLDDLLAQIAWVGQCAIFGCLDPHSKTCRTLLVPENNPPPAKTFALYNLDD
jgi:hypothetical protein